MAPRRNLLKRSIFDSAELLSRFRQAGIKEVHAWNLWRYLIKNPQQSWRSVPQLPKAAYAILEAEFALPTIELTKTQSSSNGETTKFLLKMQDGLFIETVIMQYDTRGCGAMDSEDEIVVPGNLRATVCVSSQVGCRMGCTFCATGTMGLNGNLTCGEIVEQLLLARHRSYFRNVVFMGMGEPLDNYENVKDAIQLLTDSRGFGLARKRVTISTVGVYNKFERIAEDLPGVSLAFSLHAPTQELRQRIVPSARAYKLDAVIASLDAYQQKTHQRVFVEYVLIADVNDNQDQAHQVGQLLRGKDIVLNLIPFNPIYAPSMNFQAPNSESVQKFQRIVMGEYGIRCTIRKEKGQDISSACGQLTVSSINEVRDLEDLAS